MVFIKLSLYLYFGRYSDFFLKTDNSNLYQSCFYSVYDLLCMNTLKTPIRRISAFWLIEKFKVKPIAAHRARSYKILRVDIWRLVYIELIVNIISKINPLCKFEWLLSLGLKTHLLSAGFNSFVNRFNRFVLTNNSGTSTTTHNFGYKAHSKPNICFR